MTSALNAELRRETATVAFVDVVESVRLIAASEAVGVRRIRDLLTHMADEVVPAFGGQVAETRGDGLVLTFPHTRAAASCVALLHRLAAAEQAAHPGASPLHLRAGLHRTQLLADQDAIYGIGVNLAARIAAEGRPGDTLMSAAARDELISPLDGQLEDLGPCWLKHVEEPVRLFRHQLEVPQAPVGLEEAISARMRLRPTLAVLPFDDNSRGAGPAAFAPGDVLADQLTRLFSQSSALHVISPHSSQALRGRNIPLDQIFSLLRANYLLRGRVDAGPIGEDRRPRVNLWVELWRLGAGEPIWCQNLTASSHDLLSTQGEIVGRISHEVSHRILAVEQRAARATRALPNLASHTMYLAAVDLLHRFATADFQRSRDLLVALSERAPRHPEPLAWLARWHVFRVVQGWSEDKRRDGEQALYYSHRALDLDPQSALALTMAGSVHAGINQDPVRAQECYDSALQHNPNDSLAWLMSSVAQGFMDERMPALAASETALGLAPVEPTRYYYDALSATAALRSGEYERCIALAQRSITANVLHGSAYRSMAIAQGMLGRELDAADTVRRLLTVEPHFTVQAYRARVPGHDAKSELFARLLTQAGLPTS